MEWSLWTQDIEEEIVPLCRELGIGIVLYSPLGRGFFGCKAVIDNLALNSSLVEHPRFQKDNREKNKDIYARIEHVAGKYDCTPAQLALAWILKRGDDVLPISGEGTTKIKNLVANIGSLNVKLTKQGLKEIANAVPLSEIAGVVVTFKSMIPVSWKFANTPPKA